ncbi:MAG: tRNA (adenosine(37)-N6)-dimethylallyltransferase MiaA [Alphaproteobacteria bacterium]|nr:tRNA (adenosine(37)-N6)-dimethylallyltransferase MiaA [Alphaproteobacteria bacterium]
MTDKIIIITGATASGKSAIALSLAQKSGGVIINADSQQMYGDLRVLTARPSEADEALVPHKLYGVLNADEPCSAGKWLRMAGMEIDWALSQNITPIVCGGTGLYLKALTEGIANIPEIPPNIRDQAQNDYEFMGKIAFENRLREIDPAFFERLKVYDKQRLIRAYAVWLGSGKTLSWWQSHEVTPPYAAEKIKLYHVDISRENLYDRCNQRFGQMLEQGALQEVENLMKNPPAADSPIMKTLGLRELSAHLNGELSLAEATEKAQQNTRNYAKRQLTWIRNQFPQATSIRSGYDNF